MQISHSPLRGRKLPRVMGGSTGSTKEICEISGLPIPMVPLLHQCNGYIKRKLRAWKVQKCIALVSADIALTSAGPQTTPCHAEQYMVHQGNMRNFGPTNTHGTASAPMQWLYQKEATGMESSKMYCPSRCRYRTYQFEAANCPVSWMAVQGPPRKYAKFWAYKYPWYRVCTNAMAISKGSYGHGEFKNVLPYSVQISHLPVRGRKLHRVMGGSTRSTKEICETSGLPIPMVLRLHQCNGYIKKEVTGMESSKMYCSSRFRNRTYQCGAANYTVSWGAVQGPPRKYAKLQAYQYPWYRVCTNAMVISKGSYGHGEFKNVLP